MDIMVIGHTTGTANNAEITGISCHVNHEQWFRVGDEGFKMIPRSIEYKEIHDDKLYDRFMVIFKDVSRERSEFGIFPAQEHMDADEFIAWCNKHYSHLKLDIEVHGEKHCTFWEDAIVVNDSLVGGNDRNLLWDRENRRYDLYKYA